MFVKKVNSTIGLIIKPWFILGIFILPLVFWPWAAVPYEIPKVWFFQRWVEILGVLGVLGVLGNPPSLKLRRASQMDKGNLSLILLVIGFVLLAVVSSVLGVDFNKSVFGNYYRSDGLLTLFHLAGLFYFLVLFWEKSWERLLAGAVAAGSLVASVWTILLGILGRLGPPSSGSAGLRWVKILGVIGGSRFGEAIGATFGNPNFLAGYLLVSLPFTILVLRGKRIIGRIGIIGVIIAIILTQSRAGILGVLILGAGYFWGKLGPPSPSTTLGIRRVKILGVLGILGVLSFLGYLSYLRKGNEKPQFFPESRQRIIVRGFNGFLKRPILGWGVANFDYAFESNFWPMKYEKDVYVDKAHSNLLEVLVTEGIAGLGVYCLIIFGVFRGFRDVRVFGKEAEWRKTLLLSFLIFLFHSQTNVISINEEMFFWLMAGVVACHCERVGKVVNFQDNETG